MKEGRKKKDRKETCMIPDHERHPWSVQPRDRPEVGQLRVTPSLRIHCGFPVTRGMFRFI
jgi:hypothetical protein